MPLGEGCCRMPDVAASPGLRSAAEPSSAQSPDPAHRKLRLPGSPTDLYPIVEVLYRAAAFADGRCRRRLECGARTGGPRRVCPGQYRLPRRQVRVRSSMPSARISSERRRFASEAGNAADSPDFTLKAVFACGNRRGRAFASAWANRGARIASLQQPCGLRVWRQSITAEHGSGQTTPPCQ